MEIGSEPVIVKGDRPGKNLVILAGIHGNEVAGVEAFKEIIPTLTIQNGSVTFLFGNLEAIALRKRLVQVNLNRLFKKESALTQTEKESVEYSRSRQLLPYLEKADALLDIHSSGTPESQPFVICDGKSFDVAKYLPAAIISSGWDDIHPGSTDAFVNAKGGMGICIECGFHDDPSGIEVAKTAVLNFLYVMGAMPGKLSDSTESKRYIDVTSTYITTTDFIPTRDFRDFERVKTDEVIGTDGGTEIKAKEEGVVIFVSPRKNPGEEAFVFGVETLRR